jgi:hypothetical protein
MPTATQSDQIQLIRPDPDACLPQHSPAWRWCTAMCVSDPYSGNPPNMTFPEPTGKTLDVQKFVLKVAGTLRGCEKIKSATMLAQGVGWAVPTRHKQLWWAQPTLRFFHSLSVCRPPRHTECACYYSCDTY